MRISNCFVIACNIQIVIRMLYQSFETLLLLSFFYLMVKSGKSFVKIGSRFQIALLFLSYRNFRPPVCYDPHRTPPPYCLLEPSYIYSGPKCIQI